MAELSQLSVAKNNREMVRFHMRLKIPANVSEWDYLARRGVSLSTETKVGHDTLVSARLQLQVIPYCKKYSSFNGRCVKFCIYLKLLSCAKDRIHINYTFRIHGQCSKTYSYFTDFNVGNRNGMLFNWEGSECVYCSGTYYYAKPVIENCTLARHMELLWKEESHADVTLTCGSVRLPAHKAILAARSPVFKAMFQHECKESKTGNVDVEDVDHEVLKEMLHFMYTGKQPEKITEMAEQLLPTADKYGLGELKSMCEQHLAYNLTISNVVGILVLAETHNSKKLKTAAQKYIQQHKADVLKTEEWKKLFFEHTLLAYETVNYISV